MPMVSFWYLEAMVFGELHIFLVATGFLQICCYLSIRDIRGPLEREQRKIYVLKSAAGVC
jgi:hypothetical protein